MRGQLKATGLHLLDGPEGSLAPAPADTRPSSNDTLSDASSNYQVPGSGLASYLENQCPLLTQILVRPRYRHCLLESRLPEAATYRDPLLPALGPARQQHVTAHTAAASYALGCPAARPQGPPPVLTAPGASLDRMVKFRSRGLPPAAGARPCPGVLLR